MSYLRFFWSAFRNNCRTVPLSVISTMVAWAAAFVVQAWVLRMNYRVELGTGKAPLWYSLIVQGVFFAYLYFMLGYYLDVTKLRNQTYRRLGAARTVVAAELVFELLLLFLVSVALGAGLDTVLNRLAPRPEMVRYLDWVLFIRSAGITCIAPAAVVVIRSLVYTAKSAKRAAG